MVVALPRPPRWKCHRPAKEVVSRCTMIKQFGQELKGVRVYSQSGSLAMERLVALLEPSWCVHSALFRVGLEKEQFQELTVSEKPMVVD